MGIGIVVRDEKGSMLVAASKSRQGNSEPVTGEVLASFHVASICKEMGFSKVWLEGDAKIIVDALNSDASLLSRYSHLVEDTLCILQTFLSWSYGFVHREAHEAAYRLAKVANINISDRMGRDQTPDCISDIILMERSTLSL
jgi:hypothetical protein